MIDLKNNNTTGPIESNQKQNFARISIDANDTHVDIWDLFSLCWYAACFLLGFGSE